MNNFKKIVLGIAAVALTLSFSAFKDARNESATTKFAAVNYGWDEGDQLYRHISGTPNPSGLCEEADETCVIIVDTDNPTPPETLTKQQSEDADAQAYPGVSDGSYFN